jgi:hypothetical protein
VESHGTLVGVLQAGDASSRVYLMVTHMDSRNSRSEHNNVKLSTTGGQERVSSLPLVAAEGARQSRVPSLLGSRETCVRVLQGWHPLVPCRF